MRTVVHPAVRPPRTGPARATWWGRAWVRAVEEASYSTADLLVARRLSRGGHVGQIMVEPGRFVASVEDGRGLWTVAGTSRARRGGDRALVETVAAESGRIAALLGGDLPHALVEHAEEAGVELLPYGAELGGDCTCDAWTPPCAHALAVMYQLTWLSSPTRSSWSTSGGSPREDLFARLHRQSTRDRADSTRLRGGLVGPHRRHQRRPRRRGMACRAAPRGVGAPLCGGQKS